MTDDPVHRINQQMDELLLDFGRHKPLELLRQREASPDDDQNALRKAQRAVSPALFARYMRSVATS